MTFMCHITVVNWIKLVTKNKHYMSWINVNFISYNFALVYQRLHVNPVLNIRWNDSIMCLMCLKPFFTVALSINTAVHIYSKPQSVIRLLPVIHTQTVNINLNIILYIGAIRNTHIYAHVSTSLIIINSIIIIYLNEYNPFICRINI